MKRFGRAAQGKNRGHGAARQPGGCSKQRPLCCVVMSARARKITGTVDAAERARAGLLAVKSPRPVKFSLGGSSNANGLELVSVQ